MLVLPASPANANLPASSVTVSPQVLVDSGQSLAEVRQLLARCTAPNSVVGTNNTPTLWWLAALQQWPTADIWWWDDSQPSAQWRQLRLPSSEQSPSPITNKPSATAQPAKPAATSTSTPSVYKLRQRAFLCAAWGLNDKTRQLELDNILLQAASLGSEVVQQVEQEVQLGKQGLVAWQECQQQLQTAQGDAAFERWYQPWLDRQPRSIQRHLNIQLKKHRQFIANKQQQAPSTTFTSQVQMPDCTAHHPNSLPHLKPQPFWQVLIDETGSQFGDEALDTNLNNPQLGRVVALAVPGKQNILPEIGNYHATESSHERNDAVVQSLLAAPVGILGFTVKDQGIMQAYSWLSAIHTLCRWVVRHLPIKAGQPVRVDFLIEQRGNANADLAAVAELLMAELNRVDAERFANLKISMQFIDKTGHPYNGYVDTIAHTWGSPAAASKDRLKKSAWLGHCLLRPTDEALGRLLLASDGEPLTNAEWLELMGYQPQLPPHSLAQDVLQQLGHQVAAQPQLWRQYVNEVSQQLTSKQYQLVQLVPALDWLQQHAPKEQALPPLLELQWLAGRLAVINHQGLLDMPTVNRCITLAMQLQQEDARLAAEVLLRLAVSATNSFQFELANQLLDHLAQLPELALGLATRGKLLSSRGQVQAFLGVPSQAVQHFNDALACFAQLSDPQQAQGEQAQTGLYRLFALLDDATISDKQWAEAAEQYTQRHLHKDLAATLRTLAHHHAPQRWLHHLLLRALCVRPALTEQYAMHYLQQEHQWQSEEFHPGPLIDFYRGWLLYMLGRGPHATTYWQSAITHCQQGGSTLQWMGLVLAQLATRLDSTIPEPSADQVPALQALIPTLPVSALQDFAALDEVNHGACKTYLEQCLPFNFH